MARPSRRRPAIRQICGITAAEQRGIVAEEKRVAGPTPTLGPGGFWYLWRGTLRGLPLGPPDPERTGPRAGRRIHSATIPTRSNTCCRNTAARSRTHWPARWSEDTLRNDQGVRSAEGSALRA